MQKGSYGMVESNSDPNIRPRVIATDCRAGPFEALTRGETCRRVYSARVKGKKNFIRGRRRCKEKARRGPICAPISQVWYQASRAVRDPCTLRKALPPGNGRSQIHHR